jgi:hypothetical protein
LIRRFYKDLLTDPEYALPVKSVVGEFQPPFGELYFPTRQEDAQNGSPEHPSHRIVIHPVDHWKWRYANMGFRTDPGILHMHEYYPGHYLEGELHRRNPCPTRARHRDPHHSQGWCFYNEEMPLMQIYQLLADRRMQLGDKFDLKEFHDAPLATGSIPIALLRWEMTGIDDQMATIWDADKLPLPTEAKARTVH